MISVKNLSMDYGITRALDDVSFEVREKEVVGLLGPNGAGKTTLMRILTTFIYPTAGAATLAGIDITRDPLRVRRLIGYLPETPPLYADMRVDDYIRFVGRARGLSGTGLKDRQEWVKDAAQIGDVWKHMISELSLGYRQRVGIAQALVHDPAVVILDEPTSGLDPMQIVGIRELIRGLAQTKTVVFSTHILQEASAVADRLVIIDQGKIIADGTPKELKERAAQEKVFVLGLRAPREEAWAAVKSIPGTQDVRLLAVEGEEVRFTGTARSLDEVAGFANQFVRQKGWTLKELSVHEPSLEEVFLGLFRRPA
ncbi:MAG: ATP-binding cassette domain-containing protein [Deltaproteobacteria bacterium]